MSDAAILIRSLMRDLGVSDHVVFHGERAISARRVLKDLEEAEQQPAPTGISEYGAIDQGYEPNG